MTAALGESDVLPDRAAPSLPPAGTASARIRLDALALADRLQSHWARNDDTSHDPYDGLLAGRVPAVLNQHRWSRLALVHLHRRLPYNVRALFGIPPSRSPYASAHFASACLRIARATGSAEAGAAAYRRLRWLEGVRQRGGWAYPFEVQTRTFHYLPTTPNVVCTVFAANAFLDAAEMHEDDAALGVAGAAVRFAVQELLIRRGGRCWFRYLPYEEDLIHNGNALAAQLLVRYGALARERELVGLGREALQATVADVRPDGSLLYGRGSHLAWVDGHHTGFVIEALNTVARYGFGADGELSAAVQRMVGFYRDRLFGPEGWPYQRPDRRYPIDSIAAAQGIQVFAKLGDRATAERIARFAVERLLLPSGRFAYARGRWHVKRVTYARWTEAPLCLALAVLATEA